MDQGDHRNTALVGAEATLVVVVVEGDVAGDPACPPEPGGGWEPEGEVKGDVAPPWRGEGIIVMPSQIRINKYLRDNGFASRREADKLVEDGLVFVNGKRAQNGMLVNEADDVVVKGQRKEYKYLAYYKPRGLATQDTEGKHSVVTEWQKKGIYPIGRLDKESEGLLILTNDGRLAREILSENSKYDKEYIVNVKEKLRAGIPVIFESGMKTKTLGKLLPAKAKIINPTTLRVILNEGKRHQIRIMLNDLRYTIVSLKRVRIGQIKLGDLKPGETRPIIHLTPTKN